MDRDFLDNVVTSSMVFEDGGHVEEYVGGYSDWIAEKEKQAKAAELKGALVPAASASSASGKSSVRAGIGGTKARKLTNKEQKELKTLPARIEALEREHATAFARWEELEAAANG